MTVLVTGAAGFIGFHVAKALLDRGERVIGVDNLNDYYDRRLKEARLARLGRADAFAFHKLDIADREAVFALIEAETGIDRVVNGKITEGWGELDMLGMMQQMGAIPSN